MRSARAGVAMAYYLGAYLFMNLGAFAVVAHVERVTGGDDRLDVRRGLGRAAPLPAAALAVSLLSLLYLERSSTGPSLPRGSGYLVVEATTTFGTVMLGVLPGVALRLLR